MLAITAWNIFGFISLLCLRFSFFSKNIAIQDCFIMGVSISIIAILVTDFEDGAINWTLIKHILTVSVIIGGLLEIAILIKRIKKL